MQDVLTDDKDRGALGLSSWAVRPFPHFASTLGLRHMTRLWSGTTIFSTSLPLVPCLSSFNFMLQPMLTCLPLRQRSKAAITNMVKSPFVFRFAGKPHKETSTKVST